MEHKTLSDLGHVADFVPEMWSAPLQPDRPTAND